MSPTVPVRTPGAEELRTTQVAKGVLFNGIKASQARDPHGIPAPEVISMLKEISYALPGVDIGRLLHELGSGIDVDVSRELYTLYFMTGGRVAVPFDQVNSWYRHRQDIGVSLDRG